MPILGFSWCFLAARSFAVAHVRMSKMVMVAYDEIQSKCKCNLIKKTVSNEMQVDSDLRIIQLVNGHLARRSATE